MTLLHIKKFDGYNELFYNEAKSQVPGTLLYLCFTVRFSRHICTFNDVKVINLLNYSPKITCICFRAQQVSKLDASFI